MILMMKSSHFPLGVELFQSGRRLCRMSGRGRGQCERLCGKARYNKNRLRMMELRIGIRAGLLFYPEMRMDEGKVARRSFLVRL